jgi:hypothetical protein
MDPFASIIIARQQYERLADVSRTYHLSGVQRRPVHAGQDRLAFQLSQLGCAVTTWWSLMRRGQWAG